MPITINGTTGIAGVDGSASTPSLQGADTNTGMFFPAADTIAFAEGGVEAMRIDSAGNVGIGTTDCQKRLTVNDASSSSTTVGTNPIVWIGGGASTVNTLSEIGFTYGGTSWAETYAPATIGYQLKSGSGYTYGDLTFCTRAVTTDTAPTERMRIDSSGNLLFNSGYGSVATAYGCRAWVNFNGTGTVAIRASGNVSSITDNGTGDFTLNFTTAMPDANYAATSMTANEDTNGNRGAGGAQIFNAASVATSSLRIFTAFGATAASDGAKNDQPTICVAVFR